MALCLRQPFPGGPFVLLPSIDCPLPFRLATFANFDVAQQFLPYFRPGGAFHKMNTREIVNHFANRAEYLRELGTCKDRLTAVQQWIAELESQLEATKEVVGLINPGDEGESFVLRSFTDGNGLRWRYVTPASGAYVCVNVEPDGTFSAAFTKSYETRHGRNIPSLKEAEALVLRFLETEVFPGGTTP